MLDIFTVSLQFWPSKSNVLGKYKLCIPASLPLLTSFLSLEKTFSLLSAYWSLSKPQDSLINLNKHPLSIQFVSGTVQALCRSNTTHRLRYQRAHSLVREIDNHERVQKRGWFIVLCVCLRSGGSSTMLWNATQKTWCNTKLFIHLLVFIIYCLFCPKFFKWKRVY